MAALSRSGSLSFEDVCIYIIPKKLPKARIKKLYDIAKNRCMRVSEQPSNDVTHIITTYESIERVKEVIDVRDNQQVVSVDWLTCCFSENKVVRVTDRFLIDSSSQTNSQEEKERIIDDAVPEQQSEETKYECMKAVTLNYGNKDIVKALEVLEKDAQFKGEEARALAFRRASCSIKSLKREIKHMRDVTHLTYIGAHASRIIQDILDNGSSSEVDGILHSERYNVLKLLIGMYGVGPVTAKSWYNQGYRSLDDVRKAAEKAAITLTNKQEVGLKYYADLDDPVDREESQKILDLIKTEVHNIQSEATVELVGGQRRGKFSGHDVDVFICTKEDHQTASLLKRLIAKLDDLGLLLFLETQIGFNTSESGSDLPTSTTSDEEKQHRRRSQMDHLDKAFTILKCPCLDKEPGEKWEFPPEAKKLKLEGKKNFKARRVDLIVTPPSQYPVSLFGWTGSKHFNRSLRLYAWREKNITISNHAIWDHSKQSPSRVNVNSEKDIFDFLGIRYLYPEERNH